MICDSFNNLTREQKLVFAAKIQHLIQGYDVYFDMFKNIVDIAEEEELFANVKFFPEDEQRMGTIETASK